MGVLEGVFCHHRQDVVTLAVLLVRLLKWINGTEQREEADELALGKWWMEKGRADEAIPRLMRAAEGEGSPAAVRKEAYRLLSAHWKRTGNFGEAIRCWEKWSDWDRWNPEPLVELAKHYEHREKDFERALAFTNRAIDGLLCKKMIHRFAFTEPDLEALRYRARRLLEKKRGKESCKEPGLFDWKD
jgi:tetratricopeptide (TPR) repeat protein